MKIAVFHNVPPGGAFRVMYEEIRFLSHGNEVDLYTYNFKKNKVWEVEKYIKQIYEYPLMLKKKDGATNRLFNNAIILYFLPILNKKIARAIDKGKYDVVLVHPDEHIQSPFLLRYLKTPSVYFCHELLRNAYEEILDVDKDLPLLKYAYEKIIRFIKKQRDKINVKHADAIVTASKYISGKVNNVYGKMSVIIRPGVDTKIFNKHNLKKKNAIVFIGGKEKVTGYKFIKDIMGDKRINKRMELLVIDRKNSSLLYSDKRMAEIYSKSLLTICTAYNEPFGLTPLESMACGTPVLAVNEGGYKETVINGVSGYLIARDKELFIDKILLLMRNIKLYNKLAESGIRYVKSSWSWERHGKELFQLMKALIKENSYK